MTVGIPLYDRSTGDDPFDGDAERHLLERAAQIQELTRHPGWAYLCDYVTALTTAKQNRILKGGCRDIEEYRQFTGEVTGMLAVLDAPNKLQQQIDNRTANRPDQEE